MVLPWWQHLKDGPEGGGRRSEAHACDRSLDCGRMHPQGPVHIAWVSCSSGDGEFRDREGTAAAVYGGSAAYLIRPDGYAGL
jgi:hypothetical protein